MNIIEAAAAGTAAYHAGITRVVRMDAKFVKAMGRAPRNKTDLYAAWYNAWDAANVAAPVPPANQRELFSLLCLKAAHYARKTGDQQPAQALDSAARNADDTAGEEGFPLYCGRWYDMALGSIQCAIEGNCWDTTVLFPWFAAAGHTI